MGGVFRASTSPLIRGYDRNVSIIPNSQLRPVVLLPTYNESENLEFIVHDIFVAQNNINILIIDDNSPDGTGDIAAGIAAQDERVELLRRPVKEGLGRAYVAGIKRALADPRGFTHLIEMDADFSHPPRYLQVLLDACHREGADVAIGSRYVPGGSTPDWPWTRRAISRGGVLYARSILGVSIRDLTAGFVCFRREVLENFDLDTLVSTGYAFQIEMKYRALRQGYRVVERPITFPDRSEGESKMSQWIFWEAVLVVWKLRWGG